MANFMRFGGERGLNVDTLAAWDYHEKPVTSAARAKVPVAKDTPEGAASDASIDPEAMLPILTLTFTNGHMLEIEGEYATALHRYFRSVGSALT